MAPKSSPQYQAPLAQHLIFATYAIAFYALVFAGIYLGLDRWCREATQKDIAYSAELQLRNINGQRPLNWISITKVTRVSADEYRVQASLTPPVGDPNVQNLAPVILDYPFTRKSLDGQLHYQITASNQTNSGYVREETVSNLLTQPMKRYGIMMIPVLIIGLFWLIVWMKVFSKAGYPSYYVLIPGPNLFYVFTMMTDSILKAWLLFIGSFIPGINFIVWIIGSLGLAKNFGRSAGFAIGLMFMPMIFILILAFGKSTYQPGGPVEEY